MDFTWPEKSPFTSGDLFKLQKKYHLSPRELQLAVCISRGCSDKEAAEKMEITINTIRLYTKNLLRKCGVKRKVNLLIRFFNDIRS